MQSKFIKSCEKKLKMMIGKLIIPCISSDTCCKRIFRAFKNEIEVIPKDVPKGHLVVYVAKESRRLVIKISLLEHPLSNVFLDQASHAYSFSADSRPWTTCNKGTFLDVVYCIGALQHQNCICI